MELSRIHVQIYPENVWLTLCCSSKISCLKRCWDWLQVCKPISPCIKIQVHHRSKEGVMADVIQLLGSCMIYGVNGDWCYWHAMAPKIECICVYHREREIHIWTEKWRQNYRTWKIVGHRKGMQRIMNVTAVFGKEQYSTSKKTAL